MTMHYIAASPVDKSAAREEIESRINRLKRINAVKYAALPLVAVSAGVGVAFPVAFPIVAATTAVLVGAADFFSRNQKKIIQEELATFKTRSDVSPAEVTALSTSANNVTVAGSSS